MSKKYNYFYKITNNVNGHFYYGIHSTDNLNDGYMGSGERLKYAYKKYGIENFSKDIIKFFDSRKSAFEYEGEIVTEELVKNSECYNSTVGGVGNLYGTFGLIPVYKKGEDKIILVTKDEFIKNRDKYVTPKEGKTTVVDNVDGEKKTITIDEYLNNKDRYTPFNKGKACYRDNSGRIYFLDVNDKLVEKLHLVRTSGWKKGIKLSNETKEKIRKHHIANEVQKGSKNSQYGKIWITNGKESKSILKENAVDYLNNGWVKGRISNVSQKKFFLSKKEVEKCRNKGLTWKEIANLGNVSDITVRRFAKKNNIQ